MQGPIRTTDGEGLSTERRTPDAQVMIVEIAPGHTHEIWLSRWESEQLRRALKWGSYTNQEQK